MGFMVFRFRLIQTVVPTKIHYTPLDNTHGCGPSRMTLNVGVTKEKQTPVQHHQHLRFNRTLCLSNL